TRPSSPRWRNTVARTSNSAPTRKRSRVSSPRTRIVSTRSTSRVGKRVRRSDVRVGRLQDGLGYQIQTSKTKRPRPDGCTFQTRVGTVFWSLTIHKRNFASLQQWLVMSDYLLLWGPRTSIKLPPTVLRSLVPSPRTRSTHLVILEVPRPSKG